MAFPGSPNQRRGSILVRAVDFGSILQQEMHYVRVASAGRPDDRVNAVLLAWRGQEGGGRWKKREKTCEVDVCSACLLRKVPAGVKEEVFLIKLLPFLQFKNTTGT